MQKDWLTGLDWLGLTDWLIDWLRFHIQVNIIKVMLKCYIITFEFVELLPNFRLMQTQTLLWAPATERFSKPLKALISPSPRAGREGEHILKFGSWMQTNVFWRGKNFHTFYGMVKLASSQIDSNPFTILFLFCSTVEYFYSRME